MFYAYRGGNEGCSMGTEEEVVVVVWVQME